MVVLATSARLGVDDILRIRWAAPPDGETALVLRQRDAERSVPLEGAGADLAGLDLADGTWSVRAAGEEVMTTDPGFSFDGLIDYARRPRTRAMHAFRDRSGGLRLSVRAVTPHAEATAVHPSAKRLVIEGFFAFGEAPSTADLVATRRGTGQTVTGEVTVSGGRWRAELPTEPFRAESGRGFWDLRLGTLTVATLLDAIPKKKTKVRFPAEHVERGADRVRVRAYYTDKDHLAIDATVVANAEEPRPDAQGERTAA
jgi:hypothetical protein